MLTPCLHSKTDSHVCETNTKERIFSFRFLLLRFMNVIETTHLLSYCLVYLLTYCLAGLVVKASASGAEDPWFESRLRRDFSRSNHTSDLKIGTPVAAIQGSWHYRVSAGTGWPGISILWLGEVESWIATPISVSARKIVCADPPMRYTSMLLGC